MTSITMSKSHKHLVRDLTRNARMPESNEARLEATKAQVHKETLHLPSRAATPNGAQPAQATSRNTR
ncbi:MAG: hypothetical protein U5M53_12000 [Rhodoferax sp.]|nr:hypothetical protein [Rhodoferax sp.]